VRLVDSHCHLDDRQFAGDLEAVIERAHQARVERILAIGTGEGPPDLEAGLRLAGRFPGLHATAGVHPHDASKATPETWDRLRQLASDPRVVAIGEVGLDYHYNYSPPDVQRAVFAAQLRLAGEAGKPVIIHTREAWDETLELIHRHWRGPGGIFHCFSGGPEQALQALESGFHLAFGGVLTFPKADRVRAAARTVPLDRLLVETDAPYLAPVPHRGKRNEPAFVVETARKLAEIRGESFEELAVATTANFEGLCLRGSESNG
jgi:TatD DNase family protein